MSIEAQLPQPGEIVDGKYRVESLLGKGGMGAVFVVRHVQTQRQLALKCMLAALIGDYEAEQRFIREAKLAGTVEHPGVVATYDIGRHRGSLYMVMELLSGESLSTRIRRGAMSIADATYLMTTVLEAVAAAHHKGIVHRDLKPDNIFLHRAPDGRGVEPKILDFGISKALSPDGAPTLGLTKTGMMLGTPLYMSPEQVRGDKKIDQRTDVYALGIITYEMLTGGVPYNGNNFADLVLKIVTGDTQPPSARLPTIPAALDAVVMRAMHPDVSERFPDAISFARALASYAVAPVYSSVRPRPISSAPPARMSSAPPPQSLTPFVAESRVDALPVKPLPWALLAGGAAITLAAGAWLWLADRPSAPVADPSTPASTHDVAAAAQPPAQPSLAQPSIAQPSAPELPMGVSGDGLKLPVQPSVTGASAQHPHASREHSRVTTEPSAAHAVEAVPAAAVVPAPEAPEPERERRRNVPAPSEQILDPFSE